ncbi:MAG: pyridoxamine 5'-phosphate oxidase family protein [Actinomycetota bacterium]
MTSLDSIAPAFVEMAHRIVWCVAATTDADGLPRTRVLHPVWEWDGASLNGWIATSPLSPKAADLAATPRISLTYWAADHDTCGADCDAVFETSEGELRAGWDRFANAPAPVGYDPSIIPGWDSPTSPGFGILRLTPRRLRVMPGSVLLAGVGDVLTWRG